jgi:hypothetical protein
VSHLTFTEAEIAEAKAAGFGPYRRYGIKAAARLLGLEYSVARTLVAKGELGIVRVGKRGYVLGGHLARYKIAHGLRAKQAVHDWPPVGQPTPEPELGIIPVEARWLLNLENLGSTCFATLPAQERRTVG